jgi:hypothetical protein
MSPSITAILPELWTRDLAIRYGCYRFQTDVMVLTVAILLVIVQLIQFAGNGIARRLDKREPILHCSLQEIPMSFARRSLLASLTFTAVAALAAIHLPASAQTKKEPGTVALGGMAHAQDVIRIGVTAGPHAQIAEVAKKVAERGGLTLQIVEFQGYLQPHAAL